MSHKYQQIFIGYVFEGGLVYLDIYCDGRLEGLKERRRCEGSEPNWREDRETGSTCGLLH